MSAITSPAMQFVGNMTGLAADLAGGVSHVVSPYLPHALKPSNATMSSHTALPTTPAWTWAKYASLLVAVSYLSDFMAKRYRDKRLRKFGASAPLIPYKMPLGIDLAIYSLYSFFRFTFFELVCTWLAAVPGHTVEARMFATGLIFTEEPANIKAIMSSNWSNFGRGEVTKRIWGDMLGSTQIFVVDGEDWHRSKERIKDHVMAMRSTDLEITEKHTKNLFDLFDIWKPIEVYNAIDRYQLDVVTDVFFGETANSLTSRHPFKGPMETLHPINTARMLFGKNAYYVRDKYIAPKALADLNAYTRDVTDRAYARDLSKKAREDYTLLDDLVSQNKSYEDIKEAIMSIMLGGKDPSAILISWAIFMMGTHPNVMKKMKAEVAQVCGGKLPSAADLREMTYVKHVINECFRLYHPLGLNVRVALNDTSLPAGGGASGNEPLAVAKGTTIIYSLGGLQRRKDIYGDDAHEFRPERWEGANVNRWHFIPYNHGPRHCLGQKFGQQQMEYVLARICQEYEAIRIPPGQPKQQIRVELNLKMAHPCKVIFVRKYEEDVAAANANWLE